MLQHPFEVRKYKVELSREAQNAASAGLLAQLDPSRTILVVEDDSLVRRATCELLAHAGHHALETTNATMARAVFARNAIRIDAVICDAILPDANGVELCRSFQREQAQLAVILTSGYPTSPARLERGSNAHFLEKPYSGDSLLATLDKLFAKNLHPGDTLLPGSIAQDVQNLPG
jgi:DNA-binding NtrC family response regulator